MSGHVHSSECLVRSLALLYGYASRQRDRAEALGDTVALEEVSCVLDRWDKFAP
jgi:hypothetical protein